MKSESTLYSGVEGLEIFDAAVTNFLPVGKLPKKTYNRKIFYRETV